MTSPLINTVHRVATWGEPDAEEHVQLWNNHIDELLDDPDDRPATALHTAGTVTAGVAAHIWQRITGPSSTALPAGFALGFAAFGPLVMWQSKLLPEIPVVVWIAIAVALASSSTVLLASPSRLRPRWFAAAASMVGATGLLASWMLHVETMIDQIVVVGWILVAIGSFAMSAAALADNRRVFTGAVWFMAAGCFLLGIGHTAWVSQGAQLTAGLFTLVAGATATAGILSLRSLR